LLRSFLAAHSLPGRPPAYVLAAASARNVRLRVVHEKHVGSRRRVTMGEAPFTRGWGREGARSELASRPATGPRGARSAPPNPDAPNCAKLFRGPESDLPGSARRHPTRIHQLSDEPTAIGRATAVSSADDAARLSTLVAGDDLPELIHVNQGGPQPLPNLANIK
jgi:hypothetical protein